MALLKALRLLNFGIFSMAYVYFQVRFLFVAIKSSEICQIFQALCLFQALRLFFFTNFPGPTFIPCPKSIPDSRVMLKSWQGILIWHLFYFGNDQDEETLWD